MLKRDVYKTKKKWTPWNREEQKYQAEQPQHPESKSCKFQHESTEKRWKMILALYEQTTLVNDNNCQMLVMELMMLVNIGITLYKLEIDNIGIYVTQTRDVSIRHEYIHVSEGF